MPIPIIDTDDLEGIDWSVRNTVIIARKIKETELLRKDEAMGLPVFSLFYNINYRKLCKIYNRSELDCCFDEFTHFEWINNPRVKKYYINTGDDFLCYDGKNIKHNDTSETDSESFESYNYGHTYQDEKYDHNEEPEDLDQYQDCQDE